MCGDPRTFVLNEDDEVVIDVDASKELDEPDKLVWHLLSLLSPSFPFQPQEGCPFHPHDILSDECSHSYSLARRRRRLPTHATRVCPLRCICRTCKTLQCNLGKTL